MSAVGLISSPFPSSRTRLVVIADVRLYRDGLAAALANYDRLTVVGTAGNGADAMALVQQAQPDVAIVDMSLPGGFELLSQLRSLHPATELIAFGVDEDITIIVRCAEAGASGYVTLNASMDDLVNAIDRAAAGELECPPRVAAELFRRLASRAEPRHAAPLGGDALTSREQEVLVLLTRGLSNKEIGAALRIAEATVKNHVHHLLEKLNVGTRAQAAACAHATVTRHRGTA